MISTSSRDIFRKDLHITANSGRWTDLLTVTFIDETKVIQSEYNGESEREPSLSPEKVETLNLHYASSSSTAFDRHHTISPPQFSPLSLGQPIEPTVAPSGPVESFTTTLSPLEGNISAPSNLSRQEVPLPTLHDLADVAQLANENQKPFGGPLSPSQQHSLPIEYRYDETAAQLQSQIYLDHAVWPLTDPSEALLLRHYVQNLATWVCKSRPKLDITRC